MSEQNILEVKDLTKHFKAGKKQIVHAVDGISFTLERGKTLGLVGESGCGKSREDSSYRAAIREWVSAAQPCPAPYRGWNLKGPLYKDGSDAQKC